MNDQTSPKTTDRPARKPLKGLRVGVVVSDRRDKTRKVISDRLTRHPKYGKYVRCRSQYQVHDEHNQSKLGDTVEIAPCRPISKTKSWRLVRVIKRAPEDAG